MAALPFRLERNSRNVVTVKMDGIKAGWEQWFLLRSDAHHDNPKCDRDLENKHLQEAVDWDAGIIDNGDLFCAMQGKYDKRANKDSVREEHQVGDYLDALVRTTADDYRPYQSHFIVVGRGNHETAIRAKHETDLTDRLVAAMHERGSPVLASGYSGWIRFQFLWNKTKRCTIILHHYHGSGGGGPVTRGTIQTNRIGVYTPDANIVLTGHTHDDWIFAIPRQRINDHGFVHHDEQLHCRPPGYKQAWGDGHAGWEVEKMLGPKNLGSAWLRFYLEGDRIRYEVTRAK